MKKSSVIDSMYRCLICGTYQDINIRHIYSDKEAESDKYNLVVPLCPAHYKKSKENSRLDLELKQIGQKAFEFQYGTRSDFINIFNRSYL